MFNPLGDIINVAARLRRRSGVALAAGGGLMMRSTCAASWRRPESV
jgi:hypothetical protein